MPGEYWVNDNKKILNAHRKKKRNNVAQYPNKDAEIDMVLHLLEHIYLTAKALLHDRKTYRVSEMSYITINWKPLRASSYLPDSQAKGARSSRPECH